jgi:hypothetical protein
MPRIAPSGFAAFASSQPHPQARAAAIEPAKFVTKTTHFRVF